MRHRTELNRRTNQHVRFKTKASKVVSDLDQLIVGGLYFDCHSKHENYSSEECCT